MDNIKVTLTPTELGDIIDRAFNLGKMYAADELETTDELDLPAIMEPKDWDDWVQSHGGQTLNSGAAKHDILWEAVVMTLREALKDAIEY